MRERFRRREEERGESSKVRTHGHQRGYQGGKESFAKFLKLICNPE